MWFTRDIGKQQAIVAIVILDMNIELDTTLKVNSLKKLGVFDGYAQRAAVLSSHLDGPAYDMWKGMDKEEAERTNAALRSVSGLRKMYAWIKAEASVMRQVTAWMWRFKN